MDINTDQEKLLIIFNICEIKFQNYRGEPSSQLDYWAKSINSLLDQNYQNHTIVVSGCRITTRSKLELRRIFGNKICYNFIDEIYTLNITFNKTIEMMINRYGEYDGYLYVDSGMNCIGHSNVMSEINIRAQTKQYGVIMVEPDSDQGWDMILEPGVTSYNFQGKDFIQPLGTIFALHFWYFSKDLRKAYNRLMPDVYRVGGSEFIYPYMCSAIHVKSIIIKDLILHHAHGFDGSSSGFRHSEIVPQHCDFLYGLTIHDVILNDEIKATGMGYDDLQSGPYFARVPHNKDLFTKEGFAIKANELREYIKTHLFLKPIQLDYNTIQCEFIPN